MIEREDDLWAPHYTWRAVTTNGSVRRDGTLVMGRGTARQAAVRYPSLPARLGALVRAHGNVPHAVEPFHVVSFPVKEMWYDTTASLGLIAASARALRALWDQHQWADVVIPRPGCGTGRLPWGRVKPILVQILTDDRFIIVHPPGGSRHTCMTRGRAGKG